MKKKVFAWFGVVLQENDRYTRGAKYMDLKFLSVKAKVQNQKRISIVHFGIDLAIADPLTKGLTSKTFIGHVGRMDILVKSLYNGQSCHTCMDLCLNGTSG